MSAFHKRTCLSFPCFDTYRQTVSAYKSTREMHHASSQKTKTAASPISSSNISKMYRVLRLNALLIFDTDEPTASPYMYTHNTYRTALYTTSHCTKHVKYRMPLFLSHNRYYRVSSYLPHIVVPLTQAIPPRLVVSFTPTIPPHLVVSFAQTNLRRISLFPPHKRFVDNF